MSNNSLTSFDNTNNNKYLESIQFLINRYSNLLDKCELIDILVQEAQKILGSEIIVFLYKDYLSYLNIRNYTATIESLDFLDIRKEFVNRKNINIYLDSNYIQLKSTADVYGLVECKKPNLTTIEEDYVTSVVNLLGKTIENHILYEDNIHSINTYQRISKITYRLSELKNVDIIKSTLVRELLDMEDVQYVDIILKSDLSYKDNKLQLKDNQLNTEESLYDYKLDWINHLEKEFKSEHIHYEVILDLSDTFKNAPKGKGIGILLLKDTNIIGYVLIQQKKNTFTNLKIIISVVQYATLILANAIMFEVLTNRVEKDALTTLYNRRYLEEGINKSALIDKNGVFVLFDIDNFKRINDTFGHDVGDSILIQVAKIIQKNVSKNSIAARWGGEELVIYIPNISLNKCLDIVTTILTDVENTTNPNVTISAGVSYWEETLESQKEMFKKADIALYKSKNNGKNQFTVGDRSGGTK